MHLMLGLIFVLPFVIRLSANTVAILVRIPYKIHRHYKIILLDSYKGFFFLCSDRLVAYSYSDMEPFLIRN